MFLYSIGHLQSILFHQNDLGQDSVTLKVSLIYTATNVPLIFCVPIFTFIFTLNIDSLYSQIWSLPLPYGIPYRGKLWKWENLVNN